MWILPCHAIWPIGPLSLKTMLLQVSSVLMMEDTPSIALTGFTHNLEACVIVFIQSALPIEAEEYTLPKDGRPTSKQHFAISFLWESFFVFCRCATHCQHPDWMDLDSHAS